MAKLNLAFIGATALMLAACGSGEPSVQPAPQATLQLELGDTVELRERRTLTLMPVLQSATTELTYSWQQLSGPPLQFDSLSSKIVTLTSPELNEDSNATVKLTVSNSKGVSVSDTKQILLKANQLPVLTASALTLTEKTTAQLTVSVTDADGSISSVEWAQISGPAVQLATNNSNSITITVPAVTQTTIVEFAITATDDDAEAVTVLQQYTIEPLLQHYQLSGFLKAYGMSDAQIIASAGGNTFRSVADHNAMYSLDVAVDDDETNDLLLLRAVSVSKPGMDLWLIIPSLRHHNSLHPADVTPFTTGVAALIVRANNNVVPRSLSALLDAEKDIAIKDAIMASLIVAAYPNQNTVSLPPGYSSLFSTLVDPEHFGALAAQMRHQHQPLLDAAEYKLTAQGWGKLALTYSDVQYGLHLSTDELATQAETGNRFYQFNSNSKATIADACFSYPAQWNILNDTVQTGAKTEQMPMLNLAVTHPDLSLSAAQIAKLQAHGVNRLQVNIKQAGEQLTRFTQGAWRSLYQLRRYTWYAISPVMLDGERMEFSDSEVETYQYVWGRALYPSTISPLSGTFSGQWNMPLYQSHTDDDRSRFIVQNVYLNDDGTGFNMTSGEGFGWQFAVDVNGQPALLLLLNSVNTQIVRLLQDAQGSYEADIFVFDADGAWLNATSGTLKQTH